MSFNISRRSNVKAGFTLLEMLLVIAIIAILAAIVIVAINPARQLAQARNAQAASDLNSIQKAVQQYLIDNDGIEYPDNDNLDGTAKEICNTGVADANDNADDCLDFSDLVPTYISALPQNPYEINYVVQLNSNKLTLGAPGSVVEGLPGVVLGTTSDDFLDDFGGGGGDDDTCADLTGDERRVCDLAAINEAIQDFIDDNDHAPYLTAGNAECGDISSPNMWCYAGETDYTVGFVEWSVLADELAEYIDPLPTDPCGVDCYVSASPGPEKYFTYEYYAPAAMANFGDAHPDQCNAENGCYTNEGYGLFAENMEDDDEIPGISYGFGSW